MTPENFQSSGIFENLEDLKSVLDSDRIKEKVSLENLNYYNAAYVFVESRLKVAIPLLVHETEMVIINNKIEQARSGILNFLGDPNVDNLTVVSNGFNDAVFTAKNLPIVLETIDFYFSIEATNFQEIIKKKYEILNKISEEVNFKLQEKQNKIDEIEIELIKKKEAGQTILEGYEQSFVKLKEDYKDKVENEKKIIDSRIKGFIFDLNRKFEEVEINLRSHSEKAIIKLDDYLSEARKITGIIGKTAVTGNYGKIANENRRSADIFRIVALSLMLTMVLGVAGSLFDVNVSTSDPYKILIRILALSIFTYPAVYAARESTRHRNLETRNRDLELELAAVGPFMENLDTEVKNSMTEKLVDRYFGNSTNVGIQVSKDSNENIPIGLFERIFHLVSEAFKK